MGAGWSSTWHGVSLHVSQSLPRGLSTLAEEMAEKVSSGKIWEQLESIKAATVALIFDPPKELAVKPQVYTGFVINLSGRLFWLTAAHVVEYVAQWVETYPAGKLFLRTMNGNANDVTKFRFDRSFAFELDKVIEQGISEGRFTVSSDQIDPALLAKMDVGFMCLAGVYEQNLLKTGLKPLSMETLSWPTEGDVDISEEPEPRQAKLFVCGIPSSTITEGEYIGNYQFEWKPLEIGEPNWDSPKREFPPLWPSEQHVGSIEGMSGGPIVLAGLDVPHVVAIQGSQLIAGNARPSKLFAWDIQIVVQMLNAAESALVTSTPACEP